MGCRGREAISSCWKLWAGYRKTTVAANTAPRSPVRVITPNVEQGRRGEGRGGGDSAKGGRKDEFSSGELEKRNGGKGYGMAGRRRKERQWPFFYLMLQVSHWFITTSWTIYTLKHGGGLKGYRQNTSSFSYCTLHAWLIVWCLSLLLKI